MGPPFAPKAHSSGTTGGTQVSRPRAWGRELHSTLPLALGVPRLLGFVAPSSWWYTPGLPSPQNQVSVPPEADAILSADERPYKCAKCGKSFRESGALTRHLKSLTPCTEKIRFSMSKDVVVGKEDTPTGQCGRGLPAPALPAL